MLAVLGSVLALVAGLSFEPAVSGGGLWRICLACAVIPAVPAAAALLRTSRPLPLALTVMISAAAWLVLVPQLAMTLASPGTAGLQGGLLTALRTGLTSVPKQFLTTALPAVPTAPLLAAVSTLVWWAAAWAAEAAIRSPARLLPVFTTARPERWLLPHAGRSRPWPLTCPRSGTLPPPPAANA